MADFIGNGYSIAPGDEPGPEEIDLGVLAIQAADGHIYLKKTDGTINRVTMLPGGGTQQVLYKTGAGNYALGWGTISSTLMGGTLWSEVVAEVQRVFELVEGTASVLLSSSATLTAGSTGPLAVSVADSSYLADGTSITGVLGTVYGTLSRSGTTYSFVSNQSYTSDVTFAVGTRFAAAFLNDTFNPLRIGSAEVEDDNSYTDGSGYSHAVVDSSGRIGYGVKPDGAFDVPSGNINLDDAGIQEDVSFADGSGYVRVEVDKNGRIAWGIKSDGSVEFNGNSTVEGNLTVQGNSTVEGNLTVQGAVTAQNSLTPVAMWGDSLTSAFGSVFSTETGIHVVNHGVGGTSSGEIIARTGATPVSLEPFTTNGGTIPASGSLNVTSQQPTINWRVWHYLAAPSPYIGGNIKGVFAGVVGYLRSDAPNNKTSSLTFTRETSGSAVTIPVGATFTAIPEDTVDGAIVNTNENYGQIFWTGTNDGGGLDDGSRFYPAIDVMAKKGKIIILPPFNGGLSYQAPGSTNWNRIINREAELRARFPTLFFDARRYLIENSKSWLSWYDDTAFQRDWGRSFNKIGTGTITARDAISSNDLNNGDIWQDSATSTYSVWDASTTSWLSDPTATPRNEQVDGNGDFIGFNSDYDVTNNQIPRALRDDPIHLNSYGYKMLAEALNLHIKSRHWYD